MFPADFISGSHDFTQHLTSGELIWFIQLTRASWCRLRARVQGKALSSLLKLEKTSSRVPKNHSWKNGTLRIKSEKWVPPSFASRYELDVLADGFVNNNNNKLYINSIIELIMHQIFSLAQD